MSNGGALVRRSKSGLIPSKEEIVKDAIKWFASKYGIAIAESMLASVDHVALWKRIAAEKRAENRSRRALTSGAGSGSGSLMLIAFALFAFSRKSRR
jgi:hypothetical protein